MGRRRIQFQGYCQSRCVDGQQLRRRRQEGTLLQPIAGRREHAVRIIHRIAAGTHWVSCSRECKGEASLSVLAN
jgi:hypothetical protein